MEEKLINNLKDKIEKIVDLSDDIFILNKSSLSTEIEELKNFYEKRDYKEKINYQRELLLKVDKILNNTLYEISKNKEIKFFMNIYSEIVCIKNKYLYIISILIRGYNKEICHDRYKIFISKELLKEILAYKNIKFNDFYKKLKYIKFGLWEENENIGIIIIENLEIYTDDKLYFINNLLTLNFELEDVMYLKNSQKEIIKSYDNINELLKTYNKDIKKLGEKTDKIKKEIEKEKIDLVAILGIFVAIFTLISLNFSFAKEITKDQITTFFILEGGLIFSLTFFNKFLRFFIKYITFSFFRSYIYSFTFFNMKSIFN
mgnify:CR=1 FL=1